MNVWFLSERQFISPSSASMHVTLDVCRPFFESFEFVLICNWERMRSRRPTNTFYTTPAGVSTRFLSVEFTYFTFGENLSPVRIKNYTQQLASCGPKSPRWLAKGGPISMDRYSQSQIRQFIMSVIYNQEKKSHLKCFPCLHELGARSGREI